MIRPPEGILTELVGIPSASEVSNGAVIAWIDRFLQELGWCTRVIAYEDAAGVRKENLIGSPVPLGDGCAEVELALVCHTDTVPAAPGWAEGTTLCERDGSLHGLGACDVKGFGACVLAAVQTVESARLRRPMCVVFTADEEIGCRGARFLAGSGALRARYAVVGEPTSMDVAYAGKGYCLASVKVHGKAAHSAFPEAGASAIVAAARMIVAVQTLAEELKLERDEAFSPPYTSVNVGVIQGGTAKNVVAEACSFLVEWRPVPAQPARLVVERLRGIAERVEAQYGGAVRVEVEVQREDVGFASDAEGALARAVQRAGGGRLLTIAFGTEAPWMARMGADVVVVGPGSMLTAHSARECVPKSELARCVDVLRAVIQQMCG